jgi:uncharacterized membrane protein YagU involved in acid resistance
MLNLGLDVDAMLMQRSFNIVCLLGDLFVRCDVINIHFVHADINMHFLYGLLIWVIYHAVQIPKYMIKKKYHVQLNQNQT